MRISSSVPSEALRQAVSALTRAHDVANREMASGLKADIGVALGEDYGRLTGDKARLAALDALDATDALAASRLAATQSSLDQMKKGAESLRGALLAARASPQQRAGLVETARAVLAQTISALNADASGVALFGGQRLDAPVVAAYDATRATGPAADIAAAFQTAFGVTQDAPGVAAISAADMRSFLDSAFHAPFSPPGWSAWSRATDATMTTTVAPNETAQTSASANEAGFRALTEVATMVADLGAAHLNEAAFGALVDKAISVASSASDGLSATQTRLGAAQQRIADAQAAMQATRQRLTLDIDAAQGVDPYDAATRVNDLGARLEQAYALTTRLNRLSLLNYL
ncbi:MAG: flagellar hook-associated family protein [Rhizobiales bacterium]|nr:flagellar hook-associated family protein [Hyphomicrobiales bacterium]